MTGTAIVLTMIAALCLALFEWDRASDAMQFGLGLVGIFASALSIVLWAVVLSSFVIRSL